MSVVDAIKQPITASISQRTDFIWFFFSFKMAGSTDNTNVSVEKRLSWLAQYASHGSISISPVNEETLPGEIPNFVVGSTEDVAGVSAALQHLVRSVAGYSLENRAVLSQWLEYIANHVDRCSNQTETNDVLKDVDTYLSTRTFLGQTGISLADVALYMSIHPLIVGLSFHDKEKVLHLSRWFYSVQQVINTPTWMPSVVFSRTALYH